MAEVKPTPPPRPTTTSSNAAPPSAAARYRLPTRRPTNNNSPSPHPPSLPPRRRSSLLSYTSHESSTTQSFASELLNPQTGRRNANAQNDDHEVTHWHSTPIAFAILPAVGGLLFKNGSAVITDALLLVLAAVFMNWSIRLPWDWYYSAQAVRLGVEGGDEGDEGLGLDGVIHEEPEEEETDEVAVETGSSGEGSPQQSTSDLKADSTTTTPRTSRREEAAAELRKQELLSLLATFLFPPLAAFLLHIIRAQLSRPTTGLISDSNLSIFLLAAEVRPCMQLVRLLATRTLHLHRRVSGLEEPFFSSNQSKQQLSNMIARMEELEGRLSDHTVLPSAVMVAQKADVSDLSAEMRKRYEPRLEGLERAVRRYEKRSTTLAMLTEQRLLSLENRLQDALSLAAIAAQHSQRRGVFAWSLETASTVISTPLKVTWSICVWPFLVVEDLYERARRMLLGPYPISGKVEKRKGQGTGDGGMEEKQRSKGLGRKIVR